MIKEYKKHGRGYCNSLLSNDGVIITSWYDNEIVTMDSNFIGVGNVDYCDGWSKN